MARKTSTKQSTSPFALAGQGRRRLGRRQTIRLTRSARLCSVSCTTSRWWAVEAGDVAGDAYARGKEQVAAVYERATEKAADLYDQVKSGAAAGGVAGGDPA